MTPQHCQRRDNHGPSCWFHLGGTCDCRCKACVSLRLLAKLGQMPGTNLDLKDEMHRKLTEAARGR
jgi:hypothetical protein